MMVFLVAGTTPNAFAAHQKSSTASMASSGSPYPTVQLTTGQGVNQQPEIAYSGSYVYVVWDSRSHGSSFDPLIAVSSDNGVSFGPPQNLDPLSGSVHLVEVAAAGSNVYVVWADTSTNLIYYTYSNANGQPTTWSPPLQISASGVKAVSPLVAATGTYVYIVWTGSNKIFFVSSSNNGATLSTPVNLATGVGTRPHEEDMAIAGNNVYIVYDGGGTFFTASNNNGKAGSWSTVKNLALPGREREPIVAAAGNNVYVTWTENNTKVSTLYQVFFRVNLYGGDPTKWGLLQQLSHGDGKAAEPQVAAAGNSVYILYRDRVVRTSSPSTWGMYFIRSLSDGAPGSWTNSTSIDPVTGDVSQTMNNTSWGRMDASGSGVYLVWTEQCCGKTLTDAWNVFVASSHDYGNTFSLVNVSPDNGQDGPIPKADSPPVVASSDGGFGYFAWQDNSTQVGGYFEVMFGTTT